MIPVILASGSPRRKELLATTNIPFTIINSAVDEVEKPGLAPSDLVQDLASQKAAAVAEQYPNHIIIGADTLVFLGAERFGKPKDEHDACRMLTALSGTTHSVYTGVVLRYNQQSYGFTACTNISFNQFDDDFIDQYIASGSPMDKAGSYGIQDLPPALIAKIDGEFDTVMGFPREAFKTAYDDFLKTII
ncbi:Maf family protein [Culicoidibacter larvae]|uniref:dTTP/UTP pyrophosphatase n=1 Tax=Culicoidibacter larvae TaxID=2579976 RepID=A0A5R8QHH7_9FIRM|nr:Maf family protein [Culicoidibacter larvae]TLG77499.1 septum formation protein Maf [Culicoidibacter larvae]